MSIPATSLSEFDASSSDDTNTVASQSQGPAQKKRRTGKNKHPMWQYARKAIVGDEPKRLGPERGNRKIWYCRFEQCSNYSAQSSNSATLHLRSKHGIILEPTPPSRAHIARQQDLRQVVNRQQQQLLEGKNENDKEVLRRCANPALVPQALLRLIVHHDLPLNAIEWPELHTFVSTLNFTVKPWLWKSHSTLAARIDETFTAKKTQLKNVLQQSRSLIHITTDTWHSPNHKELQAITASFVTNEGSHQKALLDLCELPEGHAGAQVAPFVLETLKDYQIEHKLGYLTADNHGANDTLCEALAKEVVDWKPSERRLRCVGHIINLAVQAFFHATNAEAIELAISQATAPATSIDEQLVLLSEKDDSTGWIKVQPLQKVLLFVTALRRSDKLYNAFKRDANRTIRAPNETRWNSYLTTFEDALSLKVAYAAFLAKHSEQLSDCELSNSEWHIIETTVTFLEPFKEATKQCEGDYVTLDKVQTHMDALVQHYKEQQDIHSGNKSLSESLFASWYVFDKYYNLIDQTGAYTAAILLHPSKRLSYLQLAWKQAWIKPCVKRSKTLWQSYKKELVVNEIKPVATSFHARYLEQIAAKQSTGKGAMDEFERFINSPTHSIDIPLLDWWQQEAQIHCYPQLNRMAIDVLSAPAMSSDCERIFSGTRRSIPWTRNSLEGPMIRRITCLKHWQHSGVVDDKFKGVGDSEELDIAYIGNGSEV